ncbi:MAG: uroporphyrinogen-III synthase [Acidimicrobiales bacterium]
MTAHPLAGRRVVITRARAQSTDLAGRLEHLGATVIELPVIAIDDPADGGAALAGAAERLASGAYEWVALTSPNAAARLLNALGGRRAHHVVRWAAVGAGTARTLADAGVTADLVPTVSMAGSLADAFPVPAPPLLRPPVGRSEPGAPGLEPAGSGTVLFPKAETVRGDLARGLRAKGWVVDEVIAYRTVAFDPGPDALASAGRADAVAFTSSSTVERTTELLGPSGLPAVVVTIGPVTSSSVRSAGLHVSTEADPHTLDGLVAALVTALGAIPTAPGDRSGRLP